MKQEDKKFFEKMYGNLACELHIMYRNFLSAGFDRDEAMNLMTVILSQHTRLDDYKHRSISFTREEKIKRLRENISLAKKKETTNDDRPFQEVMMSVLGDMTNAQAEYAIGYLKEKLEKNGYKTASNACEAMCMED